MSGVPGASQLMSLFGQQGAATAAQGMGQAGTAAQQAMAQAGGPMGQLAPILEQTITGQASALPSITGGMARAVPGMMRDPTHMFPDASVVGPAAAPAQAPGAVPTNPQQAIPPVQGPDAISDALAKTASVQDIMLKSRRNPQAVSPNLFVPTNVRAPKLGAPLPQSTSPLQRYAMMLRGR